MKKGLITVLLLTSIAMAHTHPRHHLRHSTWLPAFPPSTESLLLQNQEIDRLHLARIKNDAELKELVSSGVLVPLQTSVGMVVDDRLDRSRRYCLPETLALINLLSTDYYTQFKSAFVITSAIRTEQTQLRLRRWNHNAAPVRGPKASSHLAGTTFDIARRNLTPAQVRFLEAKLLYLHAIGKVIVEEERWQPCFHVMALPYGGDFQWGQNADGA
jgi:hypothetical protein